MDEQKRISYYLGNLKNIEIKLNFNKHSNLACDRSYLLSNKTFETTVNLTKSANNYLNDLKRYISSSKLPEDYLFMVCFGDVHYKLKYFTLTKSRPVDLTDNNAILLNLNYNYHWNSINLVDKFDIPFNKKDNKIIWRGTSTNFKNLRINLVEKFQSHPNKMIDIKFNFLCQGHEKNKSKYILSSLSVADQLKSKFIISIEGNDVSTSLKWILYSNSCVIMPPPTVASWLMEDKLIPYEHYVPIKSDYSDLESQYEWCLKNLELCEKIANNGKLFIKNFLDPKTEQKITETVLQEYCKNIKFIHDPTL